MILPPQNQKAREKRKIASLGRNSPSKAFSSDGDAGARRRKRCFCSACGKIRVNRSWPSTLDSLIALNSSSVNRRHSPDSRSDLSSIWNSSAGTRKTNRTPPFSRGSAKMNWLFHSPRPATEEELADGLSPTDADWKTGITPPPRRRGRRGRKRRKGNDTPSPKRHRSMSLGRSFQAFSQFKIGSLFPSNSSAFTRQKGKDSEAPKQNASVFLNLF